MHADQGLVISSLQNPKIKDVIRLRDRHERDLTGLFIVEGYRETLRAADADRDMNALFVCPDLFLGVNEPELINRIGSKGVAIFTCTKQVFEKMSYRDRPDGIIAVAKQKKMTLSDLEYLFDQGRSPLIVVAEAIEKPGNLGTILRSSDAVGADALIVCDRCTDIHNPNVVRASVGTLFTVPTVEAEGQQTLAWLKNHGVRILAATPGAEREYTEVDLTGPVAIAVGTEQLGLSERWMKQADIQVRIPMNGVADSLNVAMATTLLMYEAHRQRKL
jgi:TrmH family RNA methyltransferase